MQVGDKIRILFMNGEPSYTGRTGVVRQVDTNRSVRMAWGTWGFLAISLDEDRWEIIEDEQK